MKRRLTLSMLLPLVGALAQDSSSPRVPTPGTEAHWTIRYTYPDTPPAGGAGAAEESSDPMLELRAQASDYVVTGNIARHELTLQNGTKQTIYIVEHYKLTFDAELKKVLITDLDRVDSELPEQLFQRQFPGLEWLKPEFYNGVVNAFGQQCLYFLYRPPEVVPESETPSDDVAKLSDQAAQRLSRSLRSQEAWISLDTGLPIAYRNNGIVGRYAFQAKPSSKVVLPSEYVAALKARLGKGRPPGQAVSLSR
jgi:hypothetical protein